MSDDQNNIVTLKVRVTAEFREKIATTAKENNRSMNAEIVARLEESFPPSNMDSAYRMHLKNKINNLIYTIERLSLQINNAEFLIRNNKNNENEFLNWKTIKEFTELEKEYAEKALEEAYRELSINPLNLPEISPEEKAKELEDMKKKYPDANVW